MELQKVGSINEFDAAIVSGKHGLSYQDVHGDTKHIWDPTNPAEVEAARALFDSLRAKGYFAFSVKDKGQKGERIDKFDPESGKIIMTSPPVGG